MAEPPGTPQPKFQFKMKMDMGQFLAKMEEKATYIKKKGAAGLRTSKSRDGLSDFNEFDQAKSSLSKHVPQEPKLSPEEFQAILEKHSTVAEYDVVTNLLSTIPNDGTPEMVDALVKENQRVLDVVNYRLFELISTESFMQGVVQIGDIGSNLETSMVIAKNGRRIVQRAMEDFRGVFSVLQMVQRRHSMLKITEDLERVQKVLGAHEQLQLAHSRGDYPEAVRLFLICLENMRACSPLAVVNELASILQETYTQIQTRLDKALSDCCHKFNPQTYEKVFNAYKILGKSSRIVEKMQSSFVDPIETETRSILLAHVLLAPQNMARAEQCKNQMKFKDLCEALTYDHYVNCLLTILEYLFEVMSSHYTMKKWHQDKLKESGNDKFFSDVLSEMDQFKKTMWDNMQRRVAAIFSTPNLSSFKIDDFLKVLDGVFQFVDIGEGFGSSVASNLRNAILQQSKSYFESFHRGRAEELRSMLSNESWVRCPVAPRFSLGDIKEYSNVVSAQVAKRKASIVAPAVPSDTKFVSLYTAGNPFSKMIQYQKKSAVATVAQDADSDDEPEELKADRVDEGDTLSPPVGKSAKETITEGPVVTTTVINTVKILGRYLYMLKVLAPISFEVFVGLTQVFQYFMYTIYLYFGAPPSIQQTNTGLQQQLIGGLSEAQKLIGFGDDAGMPPKLKQIVSRFKDKFGTDKINAVTLTALTATTLTSALQLETKPNEEILKVKWTLPKMTNIELANPRTNYGLAYRVVGAESLAFLVAAMQEAKQYIQTVLPATATDFFNNFYNEDVAAAEQFKLYAYKISVSALFNTSQFTAPILSCNWDSNAVPTKASPYVDVIFKEYQQFAKKLEEASKAANLPARATRALWEGALVRGMEVIVDAFSRIKKCSNEGRVVMMQDVDTLREKLEKLSGIRPIPNIGYVETYVKAFYQLLLDPNADVLAWYKQHPEYTTNQVISLLNLGSTQSVFQSARRQTIINALKDMGK